MKLANRVQNLQPGIVMMTMAKAAKVAASGRRVIRLGVGEPDFETPPHVREAGIAAIRDNTMQYTAADGLPALKEAIVRKLQRENGLTYGLDQVTVSCGSKQGIYNVMQATLNPGDEFIVPAPYWTPYPEMVRLAEAVPVIVAADLDSGLKMTPEQLARAISPRTRGLLINSPCNPSGAVYSAAELQALGEVLKAHPDVLILSDDIYEHLVFDGSPFSNILNVCPELAERTVLLNGVSKTYAMTGWRLGYAAGPRELIRVMTNLQSQSTLNPPTVSQHAAIAALNGDHATVTAMAAEFRQRHDFVRAELLKIADLACLPSQGSFFAFPYIQAVADRLHRAGRLADPSDAGFADYLLHEGGISLVPGSAFGAPGYVRISFATSRSELADALGIMQALCA